MSDKQFAPCLKLPAGTRHVVFADLPHLIAVALWPEVDPPSERRDFAYGGARINLEEELAKAVAEGHLTVRDSLTLGLHTFPVGDALQHSVVLLEDLRAFLVKRGGGIEVRIAPSDNDLIPLGLVAREAALRETPPVPGENDLRRDIRNAVRKTTEEDFARRLSTYLAQGKLKAVNPLNGAPFDPELPHLDPSDPTWALDNAEHEKALELLGQLKRTDEAGLVGTSVQSTAAHAAEAAAKDARQARGFYTLREAAQLLADAHGLNAQKLLQQLTAAFPDGLLVVRDPETQAPLKGGRLRDFHDWVTAEDINELLSKVWRVPYRFPGIHDEQPDQAPQEAAGETRAQRCARLLRWLRDEEAKQPRGALARVVVRDGRARQTVSADIAKAREIEAADAGPISAMARIVRR